MYAWFSALTHLSKEHFSGALGGKLLLYGPLDAEGAAVGLGGNIAGLATLSVDEDGERLKQGVRAGFCDFLVNNLDEALRILKNEVRKRQPVSVCLQCELAATLEEVTERGVQPDLLALLPQGTDTAVLVERGAIWVDALEAEARGGVSSLVEVVWTATSAAALWLPKVDVLAGSVLPPGDARVVWLKLAPRYLGRPMAVRRYLRMTAEEAERFSALVAESVASGEIGTAINVTQSPAGL